MFQEYPKLSTAYYILLECLAQDHIKFLSTLEPTVFLYILESISEGLNALGKDYLCMYSEQALKFSIFPDLMIISGCCVTLDNILSYIFKQKSESLLVILVLENNEIPSHSSSDIPYKEASPSLRARFEYVLGSDRASSRNLAANTVDAVECCNVRGLQESVVHVTSAVCAYSALRGLLQVFSLVCLLNLTCY